jgi:hypothetical protein
MKYLALLFLATAAIAAAACADGTGPGAALPADLVGEWVADSRCIPQCSLTIHPATNPADSVALTHFVGLFVDIAAAGRFTLQTVPAVSDRGTVTGTATLSGGQLVVRTSSGEEERVDYTTGGGRLTLGFAGTMDFDGDGTPEPARIRATLVRR